MVVVDGAQVHRLDDLILRLHPDSDGEVLEGGRRLTRFLFQSVAFGSVDVVVVNVG